MSKEDREKDDTLQKLMDEFHEYREYVKRLESEIEELRARVVVLEKQLATA